MNVRSVIIVTTIFLFAWSCKSKSDGDHLPKGVMQHLLTDISLAESYSISVKDTSHKEGTKNMDSLAGFYLDVFAHYKVTQEQFDASLDWYKDHPEELDSIYSDMIPVVAAMQSRPQLKK